MYLLGFDIGGTKCAVVTAEANGEDITLLKKKAIPTEHGISAYEMINKLIEIADGLLDREPERIGISCGGPLDSERGVILSPPNLPGWDNVEIVKHLNDYYKVPVRLQNDANACALAEWKFGAGVGCKNMIFLTFGTGLGAGLILDGKLYEGTNGNAGEVGHVRLAKSGPTGYGKSGSFEGFCSGGGIAQMGYTTAEARAKSGERTSFFATNISKNDISAMSIARAAQEGDQSAIEIYEAAGKYLGRGLSILIDILNPERIIIGSIFARSGHLMLDAMNEEIEKEALPASKNCCRIVAAKLGESLGDYAAVATAII